jgi:hypothetical protein
LVAAPLLTSTVAGRTARSERHEHSKLWVHGPLADTLLGWCWLPISLAVLAVESNLDTVHRIVGVVFLISFAHQPLTLGLVYGDPLQRSAHRRVYLWAPLVAAVAIILGFNVGVGVVALMAGLWNAEHTLMQRYGVLRIYGRKAGDQHGRVEKAMLVVWLVAALAFLAAFVDLDRMVHRIGFGGTNQRAVRMLMPLHGIATAVFVVAVVVGVGLAVQWFRAERVLGATASRPKHLYVLSTLGLVVMVMINPIAGIAGYVAAHAIEYFAVVHRSLRTRRDDSPVAAATRTPRRRTLTYALYFAAIAGIVVGTSNVWGGRPYAFALFFLGALHILYDGFVWKLRRPAVAVSLGIPLPS